MKVEVNNLGIIDSGNINIKKNALNVKYGINGSGKTTISKGIQKVINNEDLFELRRFGSDVMPDVKISDILSNVIVFNQEYVNQYLFNDDIVNNSFEIFINTDEYKASIKRVNNLFLELANSIVTSEIKEIREELISFKSILPFKSKKTKNEVIYTIPGSSKFAKGKQFSDVSSLITEKTKSYQSLLEASNNFEWVKWFENGKKFIFNKKCPFCLADLPNDFNEICGDIKNTFKTTPMKQNIEVKKAVYDIKKYVNDEEKYEIDKIMNSNETISPEEIELLHSIYLLCEYELSKIDNLISLNVIEIKKKYDNDTLVEFLENNKLSVDFYSHLDEDIFEKIKIVNESIDKLITNNKHIKDIIKEFTEKLSLLISGKTQYINDFLKICGIPYKVEIQPLMDENYKTVLKPVDDDKIISKDDLSFGERNAISLILFSLEAEKNYDLIILDDPVSSFDNNKKFAIMYYLFTKDNAVFNDKTVILFTHDFDIVVDLMYKHNFRKLNKNCSFISNQNGILTDTEIRGKDISNTLNQWRKKSQTTSLYILLRLVNLRKYLHYSMSKETNALNILSSLEHLYDSPKRKTSGMLIDLNEKDIDNGVSVIKNYINDFDYNKILNELRDNNNTVKRYEESDSSIDKLQIMRLYLHNNSIDQEEVFMSFITESYHYENNEMMSLNEKKYSIIPNYIIKICDSIIENYHSK